MRNFLFNFMLYIQRASSASFVSLAQQKELKINYHSSSLMQSLLMVFEVKVDYVEGNSRMIIYNNYVEVPQMCMAKKRSTQLVFHLQPFYLF